VGAPEPRDIKGGFHYHKELRAFLSLINYYGKFIKNLSSLAHPLSKLLGKGVGWVWSPECQRALKKLKEILASGDCVGAL